MEAPLVLIVDDDPTVRDIVTEVVSDGGGSTDEWAVHGVPNSILLTKPFTPAQLLTALSHLLNKPAV
jgi:hypothetical protein